MGVLVKLEIGSKFLFRNESMSRSYKKTPISKSCPSYGKYGKREANKKVRRSDDISNGKMYKKIYCSWNIHDVVSYYTLNNALEFRTRMLSCYDLRWSYNPTSKFDLNMFNINRCINEWKRWYFRK